MHVLHCRHIRRALGVLLLLSAFGIWYTTRSLRPFPSSLLPGTSDVHKVQVLDRHGTPLSVTYHNPWNLHDYVPLHAIPPLLQQAFLLAEDKRFYRHHGVDWLARAKALGQNLRALRVVRGASTITEQAVRLSHPRPRTVWSRWLETFEAMQLEQRFSKAEILEFYLNQVPYARQRRGVLQAARAYFDRDLDTLSRKEMLALAVLVRAPSRFDLYRHPDAIRPALQRLAARLHDAGYFTTDDSAALHQETLALRPPTLPVEASHFVQYVTRTALSSQPLQHGRLHTTIDATLQSRVQAMLTHRLRDLRTNHVTDAAALVVDHHTNHVLVWASAGGSQIDAVITPRQPGSTLKPFLYALALQRGWTPATLIDDIPLAQAVGVGLHKYHNYSRQHYGPLRLREALGNSLNIPAIRTISFVGKPQFLRHLHQLGFGGLAQHPDHYGDGLALGNGEVTLLELVRAYATLARHGMFRPLLLTTNDTPAASRRVYPATISSLMAHMLADPHARRLEFGNGHLLRFPIETAVKTGTSTDYRDAWAVGFSHRYTAGVWMGNLTQRPMRGVTGSIGPALILRAIFADLHRHTDSHPLYLSPHLQAAAICRLSGQRATSACPSMHEWFPHGTTPSQRCPLHQPQAQLVRSAPDLIRPAQLLQPTPGLQLALDPRIPDDREAFPLLLPKQLRPVKTLWLIDGRPVGETAAGTRKFLWPVARGAHTAQAHVWIAERSQPLITPEVAFLVK